MKTAIYFTLRFTPNQNPNIKKIYIAVYMSTTNNHKIPGDLDFAGAFKKNGVTIDLDDIVFSNISQIAVGTGAGQTNQAVGAIAVGQEAGQTNQGSQAIAMGNFAGQTSQGSNSIILNATGVALNSTTTSSFHVKPVRGGNFAASALAYTSTGEIVEETNTHFDTNGNVGIGTNSPGSRLHVTSGSLDEITTFQVKTGGEIYVARNHNNAPYISTSMGSGHPGLNFGNSDRWTIRKFNTNLDFDYEGSTKGFLLTTSSGALNFTGQHRTFIKDVPFSQAGDLEGLIVSADQNKYIKMSGGIEAGSNAITTNESLPVVSLSTTTNDKRCFGVISASEDPEQRSDAYGIFVTPFDKEKGDTRVYINSVGEGAIWVTNINGPLESGDYITTSNVAGYGQKQDSEFLANYTVAKITMDCDFVPVTQPVQIIKKDEHGENVLDVHGQIQWEDDPSGATEKAYKIRYLDANGNITDEANHVYKAAFVGCTYHCG